MNERLRFYEELSPRHDIASNNDNENERPIMELPWQGLFLHFKHEGGGEGKKSPFNPDINSDFRHHIPPVGRQ